MRVYTLCCVHMMMAGRCIFNSIQELALGQKAFSFAGVSLWQSLSKNLRTCKDFVRPSYCEQCALLTIKNIISSIYCVFICMKLIITLIRLYYSYITIFVSSFLHLFCVHVLFVFLF